MKIFAGQRRESECRISAEIVKKLNKISHLRDLLMSLATDT